MTIIREPFMNIFLNLGYVLIFQISSGKSFITGVWQGCNNATSHIMLLLGLVSNHFRKLELKNIELGNASASGMRSIRGVTVTLFLHCY